MKILLVNNIIDPFSRGGGSEYITKIIGEAMKNQHWKVDYLGLKPVFRKSPRLDGHYYFSSFFLSINKIPFIFRFFWHFMEFFDFPKALRFECLIKKNRYDLIIFNNMLGFGKLVLLINKLLYKKSILILHDVQYADPSGQINDGEEGKLKTIPYKINIFLNKQILKCADKVVSPSKWLADFYKSYGFFNNKDITVIRNPVNSVYFNKVMKKEHTGVNLLYVGQIEVHKGIESIIKYVLKEKNINFHIIGAGTLVPVYKSRYKDDSRIIFHGFMKPSDIFYKIYPIIDYVVLPSVCYENCPTLLLEAIASKTPFITVQHSGAGELAQEYNGLLISDLSKININFVKNKKSLDKSKHFLGQEINSPEQYVEKIVKLVKDVL